MSGKVDRLLGLLQAKRYADSESFACTLLSEQPSCASVWKALGIALWMQGKDSRRAFYTVARLQPDDAEAHSNLGHVLLEFGQADQAAQSARRALKLNPDLAEAHCNLGNALRRLGNIQGAISGYRAALALQPQLASAHNNLGSALQSLGQVEEAISSYRNALTSQADFAEAHSNLGSALRASGQLVQAAESYREALRIRPAFAEAQNNLGNVLLDLQQPNEAIASYRKALEINPRYAEAHNNLGNALLSIEQLAEAEKSCQSALQLNPRSHEAHNNLANVCRARGDLTRAEANYREALAINPEYAEGYNHLGHVLLVQWRIEEAIASYQCAVQLTPRYAEAYNALATAQLQLWQVEAAMVSCRRALEIQPEYAEAYDNLGCAFLDISELQLAESNLRKAVALNPRLASAHCNLGHALRRGRRPEEAAASARRALENNPQLIEAFCLLAQISADNGDFIQAEQLLQRASECEPNAAVPLANITEMRAMTGNDGRWLAETRRVLGQPLPPRQEVELLFALGKYFDDIGSHGEAFGTYKQGNDVVRRYRPKYDPERCALDVDARINAYTAAWVGRRRNVPGGSERAVFVVGMPRSGTTLVEQILASHPQVFGAGEEVYWDRQAASLCPSATGRGLPDAAISRMADEYLQVLSRISPDALRVVNKLSGNYLHLGLIHAALPQARVIHMRRHPVATALSVYFHPFSLAHNYANDLHDIADYYKNYARLMRHWRAVIPSETMLEVPYEGLVNDQAQWSRKIIEFIGLPWDARCIEFQATRRAVINTNSRWQVRQTMFNASVDHWQSYENYIGPLLPLADLNH
jgi:tetratricopeptide (TPR) repeat protein